ncbi:hypothetical protein BANRA_00029 [Escherichia coli]|nr:hypothetical protein BANRA_00029 [Escherichia coli]
MRLILQIPKVEFMTIKNKMLLGVLLLVTSAARPHQPPRVRPIPREFLSMS